MGNRLVCYKSVTGFTRRYAEMIAAGAGCALMDLKDISVETASQYGTIVFGGRFRAGIVDGLKRAKELAEAGGAALIIFATGAMPAEAADTVQQVWENNLSADELRKIPHFYMPGGLCYEKMPFLDRAMMKTFAAVMKRRLKRKTEMSEQDKKFAQMISTSYDISSEEYIKPLVSFLNEAEDMK